ncbi:MAG: FAD-binding oxidoreductase [bacterium]
MYETISKIINKENIAKDDLNILCYSKDLAPMPEELLNAYGFLKPNMVIRPKTTQEISEILKYAFYQKIPITTRAGGTWALGGTIPIEGGIVIDVSSLNKILEFNKEDEYIKVQSGVIWKHLMDYLEKENFQVGANPSSSPSATIGGFIATGGAGGIGVSKFNTCGDQIISMQVILSNGKIIETNPYNSWFFVGSEGTLGIITEVTLKTFPLNNKKHFIFGFNNIDEGIEAFQKISNLKPYYLSFIDKNFVKCLNENNHHFPEKELTVILTINGTKQKLDILEEKIKEICKKSEIYSNDLAIEEWENRFKSVLSIKKLGPTIFSPEIQVPIKFIESTLKELQKLFINRKCAIEVMANTNEMVTILPILFTDERNKSDFFKVFSYTKPITNIGYKNKGCIYGIGLYNTPHMEKIHKNGFKIMKEIRKNLDPHNILNPSKTTQIRIPGIFQDLFMMLMSISPDFVFFVLKVVNSLPKKFIRFGLKIIGGKLR